MKAQFFGSIMVGLAISAALFLPLVVWQFRRYGRLDAVRMAWTFAGFIYVAGVAAFTIFPLPSFEGDFCHVHATHPEWSLMRVPRDLAEIAQTKGLKAMATSFVLREVALNVVLFIPFGVLVRRVFEWPRWLVVVAALGTSAFIEATQYTGNWWLAPCSYRVTDVTDLVSNTTGALVGLVIADLAPRLLSSKAHLAGQRAQARPVGRGRRILGMVLDTWYLAMAAGVGGVVASVLFALSVGDTNLTEAQQLQLMRVVLVGMWVPCIVMVVLPALTGTGASLGQRTVYLEPVGGRGRLVARALVVQGAFVTLAAMFFPWAFLALLWAGVAAVVALGNRKGLSGVLTGVDWRDSRHG